MENLGAYIASFCVGVLTQYLSQFLLPKTSIKYWLSHKFIYTIPNGQFGPTALPAAQTVSQLVPPPAVTPPLPGAGNFFLLTQSLMIQNFGRRTAEWIEISHQQKPDFFQVFPALNYTETISASGAHTIRVQSLAKNNFFTIQFLCYSHAPTLEFVRSEAGHAKPMNWMPVRKFPTWVYACLRFLVFIGSAASIYWLIRSVQFILRKSGVL